MKNEERILDLLAEVLEKQDAQSCELAEFRGSAEARLDAVEARLKKVEWQQHDLGQRLNDVRYELVRLDERTDERFQSFTTAVLNVPDLQRNLEKRVRRLENPNDTNPNAAAA